MAPNTSVLNVDQPKWILTLTTFHKEQELGSNLLEEVSLRPVDPDRSWLLHASSLPTCARRGSCRPFWQTGRRSTCTNWKWRTQVSLKFLSNKSWDPDWPQIIFYKYETSTLTPFLKPCVIKLLVRNIQKLTKNPQSTEQIIRAKVDWNNLATSCLHFNRK